ncbi:MAG: anhydro-N-acetylmuramic acid kinase [Legionella sp.]|nr:anhydro-N-acetylmuramic acid kinase [Legionella sp.]
MDLYIGVMSGTSMDGIDAALVQQPSNTLLYGITKPYSEATREQIECLLSAENVSLPSICQLNTSIGREFAAAVNELLIQSNTSSDKIMAIGSHGQTLCHDTRCNTPYTLQLGCGHTIASLTGIKVIADFRTKDVVNGGQGAPFAPIYHQELFANSKSCVALVNIGGIANLSLISPDNLTQGWDLGPGNCLMDAWIHKNKGLWYDDGGIWAKQGNVIQQLLETFLSDPFFALTAPKSIGKEYFSMQWLDSHIKHEYKPVDIQATLLSLTTHLIAKELLLSKLPTNLLYLCGGGAHNLHLVETLSALLSDFRVRSIGEAGIDPDYLEAMMFSWFAFKTLNESPIDLSPITGSRGPAILGAIYSN